MPGTEPEHRARAIAIVRRCIAARFDIRTTSGCTLPRGDGFSKRHRADSPHRRAISPLVAGHRFVRRDRARTPIERASHRSGDQREIDVGHADDAQPERGAPVRLTAHEGELRDQGLDRRGLRRQIVHKGLRTRRRSSARIAARSAPWSCPGVGKFATVTHLEAPVRNSPESTTTLNRTGETRPPRPPPGRCACRRRRCRRASRTAFDHRRTAAAGGRRGSAAGRPHEAGIELCAFDPDEAQRVGKRHEQRRHQQRQGH